MKKNLLLLFTFLPVFVFSQSWLKPAIKESGKEFKDITVREHIEAFDAWWENRLVSKGKGFMPFNRWKYFAGIRSEQSSFLQSGILFNEWQKQQQNKSVSGNWTYIGANDTPLSLSTQERTGSGRINAIEFHPTNPDIIYVGAPAGGLWKSTNGGLNWDCKTDFLPSIGISDIALHPTNANTIYIATGDADAMDSYTCGLMKSTDAGETWQTTGYSPAVSANQIINRLLINTTSPDTILLATNNGIRLSANAGTSFSLVKAGRFRDMEYKPDDPSVVYASSVSVSDGAKIFRSLDGGMTWLESSPDSAEMRDVYRIALAVTAANPNVVYALASRMDDDGFYALYRSSDMGVTWEKKYSYETRNLLGWEWDGSDSGGQGWYDLGLAASPIDENVIIVGGVNLWRSNTGGSTFNLIGHWTGSMSVYVHADQHVIEYQPGTNYIFAGNDGGLYRSINAGNYWYDFSDGLQIMQIYRIGVAAHGADVVISGTQDNGTMLKMDVEWNSVLGGDGMDCMVDYNDPGLLYGEYYYGSLYRTYSSGYSWDYIKPSEAQDGSWVTPLAMHPANSSEIYAGYEDVYKSSDYGDTWSPISSNLLDGDKLTILEISKSNPNTIVAGSRDKLYMTSNGGGSWSSIYNSIFSGMVTNVCISPTNASKIWVTLSGYTITKKVFYSEDAGATWSNLSDGLPNVPANCIVYEPATPDRIYVGTDLGVYVIDTLLTEWIPFNSGMPNTVVNDLAVSHGKLIAATFGRGLWISDLLTEYPQGVAIVNNVLDCKVYPNPASDVLNVNIPSGSNESFSLTILKADGRQVLSNNFEGTSTTVNLKSLNPGIYFVKITSVNSVSVKTINISR